MVHYFIVAIQSSLIAVILTVLLFVPASAEGGLKGKKIFASGCAAGAVAALILAILRRTTALNIGKLNTWILSISVLGALVFILLFWGGLKKKLSGFYETMLSYAGAVLAATLIAGALPTLLLMPSDFILAGQSVFSTEFLLKSAGALAGFLGTFLIGLGVFHAGKGLGPLVFKILLSAGLAVNLASQAANVVQFLLARRVIPMIRWLFRIVMNIVNNREVFIFAGMFFALLLPLGLLAGTLGRRKIRYTGEKPPRNPAEARKIRAFIRRDRLRGTLAALGLAVAFFSLTGLKAWDERAVTLSPAEPMTVAGGEIIIPLEQVEDGHLHRFAWNASGGVEVRFIVIRKNAVAYGVGLDACDICGSTGYYERRDEVICRLCDVVMNKSTIGFKGGCNPVPLAYTVREGSMIVRTADLEKEKTRFQ
jgi:uncharacterized membrane protein